ncbi:MAG TPA: hypothetical protein PKD54_09340 [Pirellulaceae bacterium]|nr:hypothetical protein [Pirellulaceae bacterium]
MKPLGYLSFLRLCHFSRPACDRVLYKWTARNKPRAIVEGGLSGIERSQSIIRIAQRVSPNAEISYLGLDEFEGRPQVNSELTLRNTHKMLNRTGAKVRLLPGDPLGTIARMANQLPKADLFILTLDPNHCDWDQLWFFLPRLMHDNTLVLLRRDSHGTGQPEVLNLKEIEALASHPATARKPAA